VTSGGVSENHCTPILFGHPFSDHISFFSHYLLILYHTFSALSRVYYFIIALIRRSGKESNPTQLMNTTGLSPLSILSNDIQTHGASTISDPVMPVRNERFASPFSFSTYIIPNLATKVKFFLRYL